MGEMKGFWAVTVHANWRVIFRFDDGAEDVDYVDYHLKEPPHDDEEPAAHPGIVVLQECIEPMGPTITDAATALGVTRNTLSELVNQKRGIFPEMAVRLSKVFGGTEQGWLVQQAQYDLAHVRRDHLKLKRLEIA